MKAPQLYQAKQRVPDTPQLLLYSANSIQSLTVLIERYQAYLENLPDGLNLKDVAYTLAQRREHLPVRSFSVRTRDQPGITNPATSAKGTAPIVMVFTGQGAQWPQMGREILRNNSTFRQSIKHQDQLLQSLGSGAPSWKIEDELLRPMRTSRVNEAELSQPLCTAVQIALVDTFLSIRVKPAAVIGHSSGEIAAAYAAGSLSAAEAILVAFFRGSFAKIAKVGGMAAVGLSYDKVQNFLIPGVVVACDNSPNSVTLSGDVEVLDNVLVAIKESISGVLATKLNVEKAYHSHHMAEIGQAYRHALEKEGVSGGKLSIPFFSSVTGTLLTNEQTKERNLGPSYWQMNLESPVLFRSAMSGILNDSGNLFKTQCFWSWDLIQRLWGLYGKI